MMRGSLIVQSRASSAFLVAILAAAAAACEPPPVEIRNVLLISIDTCRADRLSAYGFPRQTTPNIDAVAETGTLFHNAVAPVPITLPAHATMLTGMIPPRHGVRDNAYYVLDPGHTTLAELLRDHGYRTAAFVAAFVLDSRFGLDQGFEHYDDRLERVGGVHVIGETPAAEISDRAIEWLEGHPGEPFFLFLHYYDPHMPYDPPEPFASDPAGDPYAGEIAYADASLGRVLDKLRQLEAYDSTLIVITGDHGEMLGEHGEDTHAYFIYDGAIRVPLVIKLPGQRSPRRVGEPVGLVDITPTVAGLLGLPLTVEVQGIDLSPTLRGEGALPSGRHLYCESTEPTKYGANPLFGLVTERWKYIETTRPELYDRTSDPGESHDLAEEQPDVRGDLRERLASVLRAGPGGAAPDTALDPESRERLRSLGYASGAGRRVSALDPGLDDPKDLIEFHKRHLAVSDLIAAEEYAEARRLAEQLVEERTDFTGGHLQLALIARKQGRHEQAIERYARALELRPDRVDIHNDLGAALAGVGRSDEALVHYRRALEARPDYLEARHNLANALLRAGRAEQAIVHYREALRQQPDSVSTWLNLGLALRAQGDQEAAIDSYARAVELDPGDRRARLVLGRALARAGRHAEARVHLDAAGGPGPEDSRR
jgi:arylsulfatase A-like enzyme/Tfp pilus assembly protein PilF